MSSKIVRIETKEASNELHAKEACDTFQGTVNEKPEMSLSGSSKQGSSVKELTCNGYTDKSILASSPNFHKQQGEIMLEEGFIKLPRSLLNNPHWLSMRIKYQKVFLVLLANVSFSRKKYSIGTNLITIEPGQICTSLRNLVDLCNEGVKFKEDKIDKNIIERSVSLFMNIGFVRHEVRHGKSIITIIESEIYRTLKNVSDTTSETKVRQKRDTNEEYKERKDIKETNDRTKGGVGGDSFLLNLEKNENPDFEEKPKNGNEAKNEIEVLWNFCLHHEISQGNTRCGKPGITIEDVQKWVKNYSPTDILQCMKLARDATIRKTYAGYVTKLLRDKIPQKEAATDEGRAFVEGTVKKNKMDYIEMKKDYFLDLNSNDQTYYHLPKETLTSILEVSFNRAKIKMLEERERELDDENY